MQAFNIDDAKGFFEVFQTTDKSQSSVMMLAPGEYSSKEKNVHPNSDQVFILLRGELKAELGEEIVTFKEGDFYSIPAGTPHRFSNVSDQCAVSFSVYAPPEY